MDTHSQNEVHGAGLHIIRVVGEVKLTYELLAVNPRVYDEVFFAIIKVVNVQIILSVDTTDLTTPFDCYQ